MDGVYAGRAPGTKFKVVLLGETGVGKSSLVQRLIHNDFNDKQKSTVGASFFPYTVQLEGNTQVLLDIWDTAGQERYRALAKMYYRGANAAIVTYDVTSAGSLERAKEWVRELNMQCAAPLLLVLAGNKCDLVAADPSTRRVDADAVRKYADEHTAYAVETSAKDATNVRSMFFRVAQQLAQTITPATPGAMDLESEARSVRLGASFDTAPPAHVQYAYGCC